MKKSILALALIALSIGAKAQTKDTAIVSPYPTTQLVTPFNPNWQDTAKAVYLNVSITSDNLQDNAMFHWVLFSANYVPLQMGDITCKGEDYKNWDGNNQYPFIFVSKQLELPIIPNGFNF